MSQRIVAGTKAHPKNLSICWNPLKPTVLLGDKPEDGTMDNQQATDYELGWLAGILDGEGWIGFSITQKRSGTGGSVFAKLEVRVNNTDKAIIDRTAEIMNKLGVNPY